ASGFLPTSHQGVPFRTTGEPVMNLTSPPGITAPRQRRALDALRDLNQDRQEETGDAEIASRIASYEMAYRMQSSAPELLDPSKETKQTLALYGADANNGFAKNCLLARRLVERGVRFVQLYHTDWDHHGGGGFDLDKGLPAICKETDQPVAALIKDL